MGSLEVIDVAGEPLYQLRAALATTYMQRIRGLFSKKLSAEIICLCPCNDIHTFGLKREIDLAFIDKRGIVLRSYCNVKPFRRVRYAQADFVVERFSTDSDWVKQGNKVRIVPDATIVQKKKGTTL